ncbi:hypothetical protein COOONC_09832 [Cooperia oncophora]
MSSPINHAPASLDEQPAPPAPSTSRPPTQTSRPVHGSVHPPAAPANVGPPSGPIASRASPPGTNSAHIPRRQEAVATAQSTQAKQVEIDSKQLLPPPLSAQLHEKCTQPVVSFISAVKEKT